MKNLFTKHPVKLLWLGILLYFIIFSAICLWKYENFAYNGLDLAIFNQVYYNSAHGDLFSFTIHPQSYLGDHFALIILLLLPIYCLFQSPITLLILQTLVIALTAWPIYLIAKKYFSSHWPLLFAFAWLVNSFAHNLNLFDFHHLPFAVFLLFWAIYFFQKEKFAPFLGFLSLSLLVREDVALVTVMFAVLALIEKRSKKWVFLPALISVAWFILAIKMVSFFSPEDHYKFLIYYAWLGQNWQEIIINGLTHPWLVIKHLATWQNLFTAVGLGLPFAFLFKPRYLLLALLVFLQIIAGGSSNSTVILSLHYSALFLPALFWAFIKQLDSLFNESDKNKRVNRLKGFLIKEKTFSLILIILTLVYTSLTLGPLVSAAKIVFRSNNQSGLIQAKKQLLKNISPEDKVVATYELLTPLSSRKNLYSLHYAFIGKRQFSTADYQLPDDLDKLTIDSADFLTYGLQFPNIQIWQQYYLNGDNNIRQLIEQGNFQATEVFDSLILMEKNQPAKFKLYEIFDSAPEINQPADLVIDNRIRFLGWSNSETNTDQELKPISLYFQGLEKLEKNYQLRLSYKDSANQIIYQKLYPLAYGLWPTSEWLPQQIVKINYWFYLPPKIKNRTQKLEIELVELKGYITVDGLRSIMPKITIIPLDPIITIEYLK